MRRLVSFVVLIRPIRQRLFDQIGPAGSQRRLRPASTRQLGRACRYTNGMGNWLSSDHCTSEWYSAQPDYHSDRQSMPLITPLFCWSLAVFVVPR